jgi:hypothetical protein
MLFGCHPATRAERGPDGTGDDAMDEHEVGCVAGVSRGFFEALFDLLPRKRPTPMPPARKSKPDSEMENHENAKGTTRDLDRKRRRAFALQVGIKDYPGSCLPWRSWRHGGYYIGTRIEARA